MPNVGDPTLDSLQRRRKMAEALQAESMAYQPMTHPLQALAKVFQAYVAQKQLGESDTEMKGYEEGQSKKLADALMGYQDKLQGSPEIPMPDATLGGGPGRPATAPDQKGAYMSLVQSGLPGLQQAGLAGMLQRPKEDEPFTLKPGETRFGSGGKPLANLPPEVPKEAKRKPGELRTITKGGMEEQQEWNGESWVKVGGGPRWQPPSGEAKAGIYDPDRGVVVDPRSATSRPVTNAQGAPLGAKPQKPTEGYLQQQGGIENVLSAVESYRDALKSHSAADLVNLGKRATMGTKYTNLLLQLKEANRLGVLNGPDYMLMQKMVTDPMSLKGALSKGSLDAQAQLITEIMGKMQANAAKIYGQPNPSGDGKFTYLGPE